MWGAGLLVLPALWMVGEGIGNPIVDYLERRPWWNEVGSAVHVLIGVVMTIPFLALVIAATVTLRRWLGVSGW